jgi:hypothetical protein
LAAPEFRDGRYSLKTSWPGPAMRGTPLLTGPGEEDLLATRNPEETRTLHRSSHGSCRGACATRHEEGA